MRLKKIDPEFRYQMMVRGFMNKGEVAEFVGCGKNTGRKIFEDIQNEVKKEGLENISDTIILTDRVIQYMGLSAKKIIDARERNKKPTAER